MLNMEKQIKPLKNNDLISITICMMLSFEETKNLSHLQSLVLSFGAQRNKKPLAIPKFSVELWSTKKQKTFRNSKV